MNHIMLPAGRRGVAMIEAGIILLMLITLLVGIMEFGRLWMSYNLLTHAVREGTRQGVVAPSNQVDATVRARIDALLADGGITGAQTAPIPAPASGAMFTVDSEIKFVPVVSSLVFGGRALIPLRAHVVARHE